MKTVTSIRYQDFISFVDSFKYVVGLTGSLYSNGYDNLYGMYYWLDNGKSLSGKSRITTRDAVGVEGDDGFIPAITQGDIALSGYKRYLNRYFKTSDDNRRNDISSKNKKLIIKQIKPLTHMVETPEEAVLPSIKEREIVLKLKPKDRATYEKLENDFLIELDNGVDLDFDNMAALNNKLNQYANGIIYYWLDTELNDEELLRTRLTKHIHNVKFKALQKELKRLEDEKESVIVVYQYSSERDVILKKNKKMECLTGSKKSLKKDMVRRFQSGKLKQLMIHSQSAAHGLNLQFKCNNIVWFGSGYSLELDEQTIGRLVRINSFKDHVNVIRLVMENTINEVIIDALNYKTTDQAIFTEAFKDISSNKDKYSADNDAARFKKALKEYRKKKNK